MQTIAVVNQKGGVCKTTSAVNLAYQLAERSQRVLLVDLDPQANASSTCVVKGTAGSVAEIFSQKTVVMSELIQPVVFDGVPHPRLSVLPSDAYLAQAQQQIPERLHKEKKLGRALAQVAEQYDFCLIDCAPSLDMATLNALATADRCLVPVEMGSYAKKGIMLLLDQLAELHECANLRELLDQGTVHFLFTKYNRSHTATNRKVEDDLRDFAPYTLQTRIRTSTAVVAAALAEQPIARIFPRAGVVRDYDAVIQEILL